MNNLPDSEMKSDGMEQHSPAPPVSVPQSPPVYGPIVHPVCQPFKPRPAPVFTRTDRSAAWISLVIGLLFMRYFFWNPSGFATTVSVWLCLGMALWYMTRRGLSFTKTNWVNVAGIVAFSLVFSATADGFVKFLNFALIVAASVYLVFSVSSGRHFSESFARDQMGAFIFPFWGFGYNFRAMGAKVEGEKSKSQNGFYILIGLLAGIPLFAIVAVALMSSDQAMAKIIDDIGSYLFDDVLTIALQLAFGIPIAMYIFGMLYINGSDRLKDHISDKTYARKLAAGRVLPSASVYAVLTPVLLLYIVYFLSQLPYFLAGFSGRLPNGFTYARYAKEGFGSLVFLTILNLAIIIIAQRFTKGSSEQKKSPLLKGYTIAFSLSTLVLVVSAFSKLFMYIGQYGLTRLRVFSTWVILLIGLIFVFIIIRQFWSKLPLMRASVVIGLLMFGLLAFGRVDYQIARYNIEMYKSGQHEELDVMYLLYHLGDDGLLYILERNEIDTLQAEMDRQGVDDYETAEEGIKRRVCNGGGMLADDTYRRIRYYNLSSLRLRRLAEAKWGEASMWY